MGASGDRWREYKTERERDSGEEVGKRTQKEREEREGKSACVPAHACMSVCVCVGG